jgi:CRISPR/Cas system-associated exonuclease Cas4 (RecB family)
MAKTKLPEVLKHIKNYKPLEINYAFHKSISYSQLSMYLSCPKKWTLQYRDGHKVYSPSIHTVFGTAIHETLQHYLSVVYNESGAAADRIDLESYFEDKFREVYSKEYQNNKKIHFSDPEVMREFFDDGLAIINFVKKRRGEYFSSRGWHLVGIEIPIVITPDKRYNNLYFNGFIDLVMYHEPTDEFVIYDIKTSTRGWSDKEKKDELKQFQILLYKTYFSEQFGVPVDNIDVKFFIVKRKIWEESEFPQKRIQEFTPANGKTKINKAKNALNSFIEEAFSIDGSFKLTDHQPNPSKNSCMFCPYKDKKDLCSSAILDKS